MQVLPSRPREELLPELDALADKTSELPGTACCGKKIVKSFQDTLFVNRPVRSLVKCPEVAIL